MRDSGRSLHTVLHPEAIAHIVDDAFGPGPITTCRLHRTYVNEVYRLETPGGMFAVKVARRGWRSMADAVREATVLQHLQRAGIVVPAVVPALDGRPAVPVETPEGERALSVQSWLPGAKPTSSFDRHRVGGAVARLHDCLADLSPTRDDRRWDLQTLVEQPLATIARVANADQMQIVRDARTFVASTVAQWGADAGITYCHGDATLDNLIVDGDEIGVFDFDLAGWSWRVFDLVSLAGWSLLEPEAARGHWTAFRDGYAAVSPLTEADARMLPALIVAHALWDIAHDICCSAAWFGDWRCPGDDRYNALATLC
ncbi:MAG: phosphotransferase, partial [Thermomicrobiales bacterium]